MSKKKGTKEEAAKILLDKGWSIEQVFDVLELGKATYRYLPLEEVRWVSNPPYRVTSTYFNTKNNTDVIADWPSYSPVTSGTTTFLTSGCAYYQTTSV